MILLNSEMLSYEINQVATFLSNKLWSVSAIPAEMKTVIFHRKHQFYFCLFKNMGYIVIVSS